MSEELKIPVIGSRYTLDGVSVDVHHVINGEVYYRRWPVGFETQPMFQNLGRMPVERFIAEVETAEMDPAS